MGIYPCGMAYPVDIVRGVLELAGQSRLTRPGLQDLYWRTPKGPIEMVRKLLELQLIYLTEERAPPRQSHGRARQRPFGRPSEQFGLTDKGRSLLHVLRTEYVAARESPSAELTVHTHPLVAAFVLRSDIKAWHTRQAEGDGND